MARERAEVPAEEPSSPRCETGSVESDTDHLALAQPTRARLFALLRDSAEPLSTAELARQAGMHPNGVRNHLERLRRAGMLERGRSSHGRGRPRDQWSVTTAGIAAESALTGGADPGVAAVAAWLARAYPSGESNRRRIESVGREAGLSIPVAAGSNPKETFLGALNRLGFDAVAEDAAGGFTCTLGRCPYREAARENREAVCALHLGITRGLLESVDTGLQLREFVAKDPDRAGCLIGVGVEEPG